MEANANVAPPAGVQMMTGSGKPEAEASPGNSAASAPIFGAVDLGTNNCRLLIARPENGRLKIVDAFSRIVRLGEGLGRHGGLADAAMARTIEALRVCSNKLKWHGVTQSRLIATEACRSANNGEDFIRRVNTELGMSLEIIDRATEAQLAAAGAEPLIDRDADTAVIFDIGGGSTEVMWMERSGAVFHLKHWVSLAAGVVTLSERHGGGKTVDRSQYDAMLAHVGELLVPFTVQVAGSGGAVRSPTHLLGTSGTVTTIAGVHLKLRHYDRSRVDGCWLGQQDVRRSVEELLVMSYEDRVKNGCIGKERADLVLAGCAILEAIIAAFPCEKIRVADRGLREGILAGLWQRHETASVLI